MIFLFQAVRTANFITWRPNTQTDTHRIFQITALFYIFNSHLFAGTKAGTAIIIASFGTTVTPRRRSLHRKYPVPGEKGFPGHWSANCVCVQYYPVGLAEKKPFPKRMDRQKNLRRNTLHKKPSYHVWWIEKSRIQRSYRSTHSFVSHGTIPGSDAVCECHFLH